MPLRKIVSSLFCALCFCTNAIAQNIIPITVGEARLIHSSTLGEEIYLQISLPEAYQRSTHQYPLLIVLDGTSQFEQTASAARHLAASGAIPDLIVVGLTTMNRSRDFTSLPGPDFKYPSFVQNPGGAEQMRRYLSRELIPWLESNYRCAPYRILHGHSLGGLFVAIQLLEDPALFQGYVLLEPSLFWNENEIPAKASKTLPLSLDINARIYIGFGGPANSADDKPFPPIQQLLDSLESCPSPRMEHIFQRFPGYGHNQMPGPATYAALRWILENFQYRLSPQTTPATFLDHYRKLSDSTGYEVVPSESELSNYLFILIMEQRFEQCDALLTYAAEQYPDSYVFQYYQGEMLLKQGKNEAALAVFRKALAGKQESLAIRRRIHELSADVPAS